MSGGIGVSGSINVNAGGYGGYLLFGAIYNSGVLIRRGRLIADLVIPDCAIQESHRDRLTITEHPVEQGAAITDHAFKNPAEITLNYAWSNSSSGNGDGSETYDQDVYYELLALQSSRQPITIITGKRSYISMLLEEITVTVDQSSEYSLMTTLVCKQVIIVSTENAAPLSDAGTQAAPQKTSAPRNTGQQQTQALPLPPIPPAQAANFTKPNS